MSDSSTLIGRLFQHAEEAPERCAVASQQINLSYSQLAGRVVAESDRLKAAQVSETSVVGIECGDDVQHLVLNLAAAHLGATTCTLPTFESAEQREKIAERVGVTHVIGQGMTFDPASNVSTPTDIARHRNYEFDAKFLFSTSGTTGQPKIVVHTEANLVTQAPRHVVGVDERFACLAPLEHNFAKRHRLYCVAQGATCVFLDPTPSLIVDQCKSLTVTTMHLSAFQAQEFLAIPNIEDLRGIRLKLGGSHVPLELRENLREGITDDLYCGYGTTETGAIGFTDPSDTDAAESVGQALPGIEIRVVDTERNTVDAGEHGEIAIHGGGMFQGYLNQAEMTEARLVDGWFYTGDTGYLDSKARLHLSGRTDDMFMFNSINIYPQDIEAQLCQYPTVVDAAVLPKNSPVHGDVPVALVVFEGTATPDLRDLKQFVRNLAGLRTPRQFKVVEEIPRNATGKILRADAQALFDAGRSS